MPEQELDLFREFEQGGADRAEYGKGLVRQLAQALTTEFGKGFDASNLWHMRGFFLAFPKIDAVRRELSWTHYRTLLRVDDETARNWYMDEAASQSWSTRALERQIGTLYYERLLGSSDRKAVEREAGTNLAALEHGPRDFVRDPNMVVSGDCLVSGSDGPELPGWRTEQVTPELVWRPSDLRCSFGVA